MVETGSTTNSGENVYEDSINSLKQKSQYKEISNYCSDCYGVEVDGFLFLPDELPTDTSYSKREYKRTSIMSGGEFVSRTTYTPIEFSFKSTLEIPPEEPYLYDTVFNMMVNKNGGCEIITPYLGKFNGEVEIKKTYPTANPNNVEVEIKIKEIPDVNATLYGDGVIEYPSITSLSENVVSVKKDTDEEEQQENVKKLMNVDYDNPYNDGYVNGYDD